MLSINGSAAAVAPRKLKTVRKLNRPEATPAAAPAAVAPRKLKTASFSTKATNTVPIAAAKIKCIREEAEKRLSRTIDKIEQLVTVRFNHYNKKFRVINGVLRWIDIDEEYCISFVYRGNFKRRLYSNINDERTYVTKCDENFFLDLDPKLDFFLDVEEDQDAGVGAEGLRLVKGPPKALVHDGKVVSGNKAVSDISKELREMDVSKLNSREANALKEARDIEDVLFSGNR